MLIIKNSYQGVINDSYKDTPIESKKKGLILLEDWTSPIVRKPYPYKRSIQKIIQRVYLSH
jgi:hypothetical protein